jgi:hypothetical protein
MYDFEIVFKFLKILKIRVTYLLEIFLSKFSISLQFFVRRKPLDISSYNFFDLDCDENSNWSSEVVAGTSLPRQTSSLTHSSHVPLL